MSHIDEKDIEIENDTELQNEVQNNDKPIEIVVEEEKNVVCGLSILFWIESFQPAV